MRQIVSDSDAQLTTALLFLAAGTLVFIWFSHLLRSVTFDISPTDLPTLLCAIVGVVAIALLAMWLPARRAARLNPVDALTAED